MSRGIGRLLRLIRRRLAREGIPADQVVQSLFQSLLARPPDPAALAFYGRALRSGATVESLAAAINGSEEARLSEWRDPLARALGVPLFDCRRAAPSERQVYVLDTPGSGGSVVSGALGAAAGGRVCLAGLRIDQLVWIPDLLRRGASLVTGPLGSSARGGLAPDALAAVVIRHPVERVAAHYQLLCDGRAGPRFTGRVSFEEFATDPVWSPLVSNLQARHLARDLETAGAWTVTDPVADLRGLGAVPPYSELPLQALFDLAPVEMTLPQLRYRAMESLESFDLVGTPQDIGVMLGRLAATWSGAQAAAPGPLPAPRTRGRKPSRRLTEAILAVNEVDLALLERARSLAPR